MISRVHSWKSIAIGLSAVIFLSGLVPEHVMARPARNCANALDTDEPEIDIDKARAQVVREYIRLARAKMEFPTLKEIELATGHPERFLRSIFADVSEIRKEALAKNPKGLRFVEDKTVFSQARYEKLVKEVKRHDRFVVVSAEAGAEVDMAFLKALKNYCERNRALLLIVPQNNETALLSPELMNENIVFRDLRLTEEIAVKKIKVKPKQMPTLRDLRSMAQLSTGFVFASPRRYLEWIPSGNSGAPKPIMTTGSLTKPNYGLEMNNHLFSDQAAALRHVMGAVVIERANRGKFHFRQITANEQGEFIDRAVKYTPTGREEKVEGNTLVLGDWHSGETNPVVKKTLAFLVKKFRVTHLVFHDIFNGYSINHHEARMAMYRAMDANAGKLSLEAELRELAGDLLKAVRMVQRISIVKSNHDEFLDRYLNDGRFMQEPHNTSIALTLARMMTEGTDPLMGGVKMFWKGTEAEWQRIEWLSRFDDRTISETEYAAHGDLGQNGARGSLNGNNVAYKKSVIGHVHSSGILDRAWRVATSSMLRLRYTRGPSTWYNTHAVVSPDGTIQLINLVDGEWFAAD